MTASQKIPEISPTCTPRNSSRLTPGPRSASEMQITVSFVAHPKRKREPKEDAMNKTLVAIATAILAATTLFGSAAEAGFKVRIGFGFPIGGFSAHNGSGYGEHRRHRRHQYVQRKVKKKIHVTKAPSRTTKEVAKAEPEVNTVPETASKAAETENSSIATAAVETTEPTTEETAPENTAETTAETAKVAAETAGTTTADGPKTVNKLDCKKFFPSVGMTLSVPCE